MPSTVTLNSGNQNNDGNAQTPIIDDEIGKQLPERGWTTQDIQNAMNNGATGTAFDKRFASKTSDGLPRNDTATVYGSEDGYIVVNDRTGEIVQISDKTDPRWIVDSRIRWNGK